MAETKPTPETELNQLTLYVDSRFLSPYAMSAYVALCEKALDFELARIDLSKGDTRRGEYARLSITQRVPTLVHGEFALSESSAIAEYLDEQFPGSALYPRDLQQRARARQIQAWLRSDLGALREDRSTECVFLRQNPTPLSKAGAAAADKLFEAASLWLSSERSNLFDAWCIADTDLAVMLNRLVRNGDPVPAPLAAYATRQWERPSVQSWISKAAS